MLVSLLLLWLCLLLGISLLLRRRRQRRRRPLGLAPLLPRQLLPLPIHKQQQVVLGLLQQCGQGTTQAGWVSREQIAGIVGTARINLALERWDKGGGSR